jgi:hypothetical protein
VERNVLSQAYRATTHHVRQVEHQARSRLFHQVPRHRPRDAGLVHAFAQSVLTNHPVHVNQHTGERRIELPATPLLIDPNEAVLVGRRDMHLRDMTGLGNAAFVETLLHLIPLPARAFLDNHASFWLIKAATRCVRVQQSFTLFSASTSGRLAEAGVSSLLLAKGISLLLHAASVWAAAWAVLAVCIGLALGVFVMRAVFDTDPKTFGVGSAATMGLVCVALGSTLGSALSAMAVCGLVGAGLAKLVQLKKVDPLTAALMCAAIFVVCGTSVASSLESL